VTVSVLLGDCLAHMRNIPDASVDAVVMDPPYCSGGFSEAGKSAATSQGVCSERRDEVPWFKGDNMTTAGLVWLLRAVAFESCRVLRPSGSLMCFMDWRMVPNLVPALESSGLRYQNLVVWDKGAAALGNGFRATHEMIAHFTNGEPAYHSCQHGNVLRHKRIQSGEREHFAQKPVELLRDLLRTVSPPGGTVLDPFAGSGSTLVAAASLGMNAIGFERDRGYFEVASRRVAEDGGAGLFGTAAVA
jgi:site-specific DNA-methyltransferase (adenine-specific)